jgi:DNA modification methylase
MEKVPTVRLSHLTDAQKRAYVIADNKLALNAGWDMEMLSLEVRDLNQGGFDLSLVGFGAVELTDILVDRTEWLTDPDSVPEEAPDEPITRLGDIWQLGSHRLMCGDSTADANVSALLAGVEPHLMVTDPPYGVNYDASWREKLATQKPGTSTGSVLNDNRVDWSETWALFSGNIAYIWHGGLQSGQVAEAIMANGFQIRSQIVWVKQGFVFGRSDYHWQHECCYYAVRGTGNWQGDRKQTTVWEIKNLNKHPYAGGNTDEKSTGHSTQKPVECMKRPIENNSSPGQAVYEPFSGSGTTIIAGEMTRRSVYAMELNPAYVDIAVKRWEAFTGSRATLNGKDRRVWQGVKIG